MKKYLTILLVLTMLFTLSIGVSYAEETEELYTVTENAVKADDFGIYSNEDIPIRDTYVLTSGGLYYLFGTTGEDAFTGSASGFEVYVSDDLETWQGPYTAFPNGGWDGELWATTMYWAPEVYEIDGTFYMFASWTGTDGRHVCVLTADDAVGPYAILNDKLIANGNDSTLYEQDGSYYLIYTDTALTGIWISKLTDDFSDVDGDAMLLFDASCDGFETGSGLEGAETYVTPTGRVILMYAINGYSSTDTESEYGYGYYISGLAYFDGGIIAEDGTVNECTFEEETIFAPIGCGHNNFFEDLDGNLMMGVHFPNEGSGQFGPYYIEGAYGYPYFFSVSYDEENDTLVVDRTEFYETFGDDYYNQQADGCPAVYELDPPAEAE